VGVDRFTRAWLRSLLWLTTGGFTVAVAPTNFSGSCVEEVSFVDPLRSGVKNHLFPAPPLKKKETHYESTCVIMRVHALPILATMVLGANYVGDDSKNTIYGLAGDDYVGGLGAADMLLGGRDDDKVQGGSGKDRLEGGRGVDKVLGKPGYDILLDQPETGSFAQQSSQHGAYQVQGGGRPDRLLGGEGNDTIGADDGKKDIIRGGAGRDTAYVDPVDTVTGVEEKVVPCSGPGCNKPPVANDDSYSTNK
jgi:Ca2+-binding RTX toxin-like protein